MPDTPGLPGDPPGTVYYGLLRDADGVWHQVAEGTDKRAVQDALFDLQCGPESARWQAAAYTTPAGLVRYSLGVVSTIPAPPSSPPRRGRKRTAPPQPDLFEMPITVKGGPTHD